MLTHARRRQAAGLREPRRLSAAGVPSDLEKPRMLDRPCRLCVILWPLLFALPAAAGEKAA